MKNKNNQKWEAEVEINMSADSQEKLIVEGKTLKLAIKDLERKMAARDSVFFWRIDSIEKLA